MDLDLPFSGGRFAVHTLTDCQSVLLVLFTFNSNSQNPPPSQPSLQSTSCNKAQIRRLPMFAFCLVYFCVSSEHIHPSQQCLGSELWWAGVWVDRILPKGASHITLDWWWQWWRWCCWWRQWRWWCWWSAINCIFCSQCPVRVKTKSQIKTSDYLN